MPRRIRVILLVVSLLFILNCAHDEGGEGGSGSPTDGAQSTPYEEALAALPDSTRAVARIDPKRLEALEKHPMVANLLRTGVCTLFSRVTEGLGANTGECGASMNRILGALTGRALANLDRERPALIGLATTGSGRLLKRFRWGLPRVGETEPPAPSLHVRVLLPASDAEELTADVRQFCSRGAALCENSVRTSRLADGTYLRVDIPVAGSEQIAESLEKGMASVSDTRPKLLRRSTAARRALSADTPALAFYSRFRALADLAALEARVRRGEAGDDAFDRFATAHRASAPYALFRAPALEFEDVAVRFGGERNGAWAELVLTPTAHGRELAETAPSTHRPEVVPELEDAQLRGFWNVDTPTLLKRTHSPNWQSSNTLAFMLDQSAIGQLQFTGYPFSQGRYLLRLYRGRFRSNPLLQVAEPLVRTRFLTLRGRTGEADAPEQWRAAVAAEYPNGTWEKPTVEILRRLVQATGDSKGTVELRDGDTSQTLQLSTTEAISFGAPTGSQPDPPLKFRLDSVDPAGIEQPLARLLLGSAPLRLRGRFDADAAVVRLAAGEDAPAAPADVETETNPWKPNGLWHACLLPIFDARHTAFVELRSVSPSDRPARWKEASPRITERYEACPDQSGPRWARERWKKIRTQMGRKLGTK